MTRKKTSLDKLIDGYVRDRADVTGAINTALKRIKEKEAAVPMVVHPTLQTRCPSSVFKPSTVRAVKRGLKLPTPWEVAGYYAQRDPRGWTGWWVYGKSAEQPIARDMTKKRALQVARLLNADEGIVRK